MRIISLMSAAVAAAAVLSVGAVVEAPHAAHATRGASVVSAAVVNATPAPTGSAASGDGNDPWD
jgi:hypothetical protein